MRITILALLLSSSLLSGCASTSSQDPESNSRPHVVNNVIISEPLVVDYVSESNVAKLTHLINYVKLEKDKLAELLYERGVIYDRMGLRTLSQLDFQRALSLRKDYADAYNFIGIHLTLLGQYNEAFEAFDSALELEPEHSYAYLNRGIALYYYGRPELAIDDLEQFHVKKASDPYRAIWLYLAEHKIDPEGAKLRLIYNSHAIDKNLWAFQLVELFLGRIDEQTFINGMAKNVSSTRQLVDRLCEGYFYLAKLKLQEGEEEAAKNYFRLALTTNVYEFVEHKYARLELDRLYRIAKKRFEQANPS